MRWQLCGASLTLLRAARPVQPYVPPYRPASIVHRPTGRKRADQTGGGRPDAAPPWPGVLGPERRSADEYMTPVLASASPLILVTGCTGLIWSLSLAV